MPCNLLVQPTVQILLCPTGRHSANLHILSNILWITFVSEERFDIRQKPETVIQLHELLEAIIDFYSNFVQYIVHDPSYLFSRCQT